MTAREVVLERVRRPSRVRGRLRFRGVTVERSRAARSEWRLHRPRRDYRATVLQVEDAATAVAEVLAAQGARRIGIPPDLDARLRPAGFELVEDDALSPQQLDELDGALTTCAGAAP